MKPGSSYFRAGGTLPPDFEGYIRRKADEEVLAALLSMELVYVLDSRQKGKSSLFVRAVEALRCQDVTVLRIDLQRLGRNVTAEQWYSGMLHTTGEECGLVEELHRFWELHSKLGPSQRYFEALESVLMEAIAGPVVVFVDEVDFVLTLPFSTDEFFAGIRNLYNRRAVSERCRRITFCLAGVASPSQLIKNQDLTPFNVGTRVELEDFSLAELSSLATRLSEIGKEGDRLMRRIHYWVGGHPYLTQLIAGRVANDASIRSPSQVDFLVRRLLMTAEARQREPNLGDVERRLLESRIGGDNLDESRSRILETHRDLLRDRLRSENHEEALVLVFLLSGVAVERGGRLRVRNRLYRKLFNETWRRNNLPEREVRRLRAASRISALRVGSVGLGVTLLVSGIAMWAVIVARERDRAYSMAKSLADKNAHLAYDTSISLASVQVEQKNWRIGLNLVESTAASPLRGWEWHYLRRLFPAPEVSFPKSITDQPNVVPYRAWLICDALLESRRTALYYAGRRIFSSADPKRVSSVADYLVSRGKTLHGGIGSLNTLAYFSDPQYKAITVSRDNRWLARAKPASALFELIDIKTGGCEIVKAPLFVQGLFFSNSGRMVNAFDGKKWKKYSLQTKDWEAGYSGDSTDERYRLDHFVERPGVLVTRVSDEKVVIQFADQSAADIDSCWFADGKRIASAAYDGTLDIWNVGTRAVLRRFTTNRAGVSISVTPDDQHVQLVCADHSVLTWPVKGDSPDAVYGRHSGSINRLVLSSDGTRVATMSQDGTCKLSDVLSGKVIVTLKTGIFHEALAGAFSPDGKRLLTVTEDGKILGIDAKSGIQLTSMRPPDGHPYVFDFLGDGSLLCGMREGGLALCKSDFSGFREIAGWSGRFTAIRASRQNRCVALGTDDGQVALLDGTTLETVWVARPTVEYITSIDFSADGRWLAASCRDGRAYLWQLGKGSQPRILLGHTERVWKVHFSPDSSRLLTCGFDGSARIWDVKSGVQVTKLMHESWVSNAKWSPDGRRVVTCSADGAVRLFDSGDGFELMKLHANIGQALDVDFTPDGRTLMTSGSTGGVHVWRTGL